MSNNNNNKRNRASYDNETLPSSNNNNNNHEPRQKRRRRDAMTPLEIEQAAAELNVDSQILNVIMSIVQIAYCAAVSVMGRFTDDPMDDDLEIEDIVDIHYSRSNIFIEDEEEVSDLITYLTMAYKRGYQLAESKKDTEDTLTYNYLPIPTVDLNYEANRVFQDFCLHRDSSRLQRELNSSANRQIEDEEPGILSDPNLEPDDELELLRNTNSNINSYLPFPTSDNEESEDDDLAQTTNLIDNSDAPRERGRPRVRVRLSQRGQSLSLSPTRSDRSRSRSRDRNNNRNNNNSSASIRFQRDNNQLISNNNNNHTESDDEDEDDDITIYKKYDSNAPPARKLSNPMPHKPITNPWGMTGISADHQQFLQTVMEIGQYAKSAEDELKSTDKYYHPSYLNSETLNGNKPHDNIYAWKTSPWNSLSNNSGIDYTAFLSLMINNQGGEIFHNHPETPEDECELCILCQYRICKLEQPNGDEEIIDDHNNRFAGIAPQIRPYFENISNVGVKTGCCDAGQHPICLKCIYHDGLQTNWNPAMSKIKCCWSNRGIHTDRYPNGKNLFDKLME